MTSDTGYKVCILTAGVGSRVGDLTTSINKGILPINNKAVISHVIEKFPIEAEIVIAVGHKKDTVMDYLTLAYPERKFTFVEVDKFTGPGSGPGYSLLACKEQLQAPFIFCTADTIVLEDIPLPKENWIGIAPVHETEQYCTVKIRNNLVVQLDDKVKTDNRFAFIGLAGIHDHKEFFAALEQNQELRNNELQMVDGFKGLLEKKLVPTGFTWFDTGSEKNYVDTNRHFSGAEQKFDFSKSGEFLYFVNDKVIKFFADPSITEKRYRRATGVLADLVPEMEGRKGHFYSYRMLPGQTAYNALTQKTVMDFLAWAQGELWKPVELDAKARTSFEASCLDFYRTKTEKRIQMYNEKYGAEREAKMVNGIEVPTTQELLTKIDWETLSRGAPVNFHGDLQFDNVLIVHDEGSSEQRFVLLDWRHEFGDSTEYGDIYYDLAKLYGGMILSYPMIKDGAFSASRSEDQLHYSFMVKSNLIEAKDIFEKFIAEREFDMKKIRVLTGLIFINMAPLHNDPFDILLHGLGRSTLHKALSV